jgi:hypothetical protein
MAEPLTAIPMWWMVAWILLASSAGFALLVWCLAPERQRRALDVLAVQPLRCLLLGLALVAGLSIAVVLARRAGWFGSGGGVLTLLPLLIGAGAGLGVTARRLGERALPESGALVHMAVGLAALVLCGVSIVGIPVVLLAAGQGLGAFGLAGRASGIRS